MKKHPQRTSTAPRARITARTIDAIAKLVARQMSESEACRLLGLLPQTWRAWKLRHANDERFRAKLEEFRALRIDSLVKCIEGAAVGADGVRADWRAAAHLLKIGDVERFGDSPRSLEAEAPLVSDNLLAKLIARAYDPDAIVEVSPLEPESPRLLDAPEPTQTT